MSDPKVRPMGKFGMKAVSVLLLGVVVATALAWWLAPAHTPWFLFGLFLGLLLLYLICRFLLEPPPPPPPPPGRRLRLINCDPDKNLRKLRVWAKRAPVDPGWRTRQPLALEMNLEAPHFLDFDGPESTEVYALRAEVDASNVNPPEAMVTYEAVAPEQPIPMEGATILLHPIHGLVIEPNHIREQCP